MKCILLFLLSIISLFVCADNLRIDREMRIVAVSSDFAELEVKLSWSNSWRNSYNYDAVYLFGKYRTADVPEWYHLFFDGTPEAHVVGTDYQVAPGNGGRGLFLFRTGAGQGTSEVTLRLKWNFTENKSFPLTAAVLNGGNVLLSLQGLEMVYLPTASFYAGDGISANCFSDSDFGILPAEDDIIGTNPNFIYTGSTTALANAPADRLDDGYWDAADRHDWSGVGKESWWRVDFKTPKRILYFGVSGFPDTSPNPAIPASEWYFEGSLNATVWDTLWNGGPEYWSQSFHTYPIQRAIKVSRPGDYRYYRVRVKDNCREAYWNNVYIANVGMTERDLGEKNPQPFLLNGFRSS